MKYSKEEYYSCYSPNQKEYLELNGFVVVKDFVHIKTKKTCWVFRRTPELAAYLEQWSANKNVKNV
jgi:hypothetical protein